jgi:hypothetical protein
VASAGRERWRVKIATAAEPEDGEDERGKFYEMFAQVNEGAILKLSKASGLTGHEEYFEATRVPGERVATKGAGEIGAGLEASRKDYGVFDGEAGALAEVGLMG